MARLLTWTIAAVMILLMIKYALQVYTLLAKEHPALDNDFGRSGTDDILLGTIIFFFNTLLYASMVFRAEHADLMKD